LKKNNQVELTDHGIKFLSGDTLTFFILPDIGTEIATIEKKKLEKDAEAEEKKDYSKISV
jgi:preprotein translocase subunit SecA